MLEDVDVPPPPRGEVFEDVILTSHVRTACATPRAFLLTYLPFRPDISLVALVEFQEAVPGRDPTPGETPTISLECAPAQIGGAASPVVHPT